MCEASSNCLASALIYIEQIDDSCEHVGHVGDVRRFDQHNRDVSWHRSADVGTSPSAIASKAMQLQSCASRGFNQEAATWNDTGMDLALSYHSLCVGLVFMI